MTRILRNRDARSRVIRNITMVEQSAFEASTRLAREELASQRNALASSLEEAITAARILLQSELHAREQQWLVSREQEFVDLVIQAASQVVHAELETKPDHIRGMVQELIRNHGRHATEPNELTVRVHPLDAADEDLRRRDGAIVVGDPSLERGDCILETKAGRIDGRISTKLELVKKVLSQP